MSVEWGRVSAISSAVSAASAFGALIIASIGGVFLYKQIQQANQQIAVANSQLILARESIYSTNQYKVQTDLFMQVFSMLSALQNEKDNAGNASAQQATLRQIKIFDAYMKSVDALHNNHGLSNPTWITILTTYCSEVSVSDYKVGDESLGATKEICELDKNKTLWKGENH